MKLSSLLALVLGLGAVVQAADPQPAAPAYPRPLREQRSSYFPFDANGTTIPGNFARRQADVRNRVLLASGLFPLPTKTPLNAVLHGRIERDDYTIDRVFFESFPGHFVCGNLYLPKTPPKGGKMPGILCPHGHWPKGRIMDLGAGSAAVKEQIAIGAERWECGAQSPLQARCVHLARMGCAVFFYDILGYNHPLVVHRVHDAMSTLAMMKHREHKPKRVILAASDGMGAVGALAAATLKEAINGAVIDTEGFRFATLRDAMHPQFVPGAVKYGDMPALLSLCDPARLTVLGEKGIKGGAEAVAVAVLKLAK